MNYMQMSAHLTVISIAMCLATPTDAAETEIVGKSQTGQRFTFTHGAPVDPSRIADFPLPPNITADPADMGGLQANAERVSSFEGISNDSQCVVLSTKDALLISCATQPKNALSGVVYEYKGTNKAGDGVYLCVVGCSKSAPRTLREITLPSGC